ncbi:hypothetical protein AWM79_15040 [Pseudomonas agarici]|uniref:DUF4124 domain-containing protein n=1 Tax=Pseudomonas agarici TaxID=46677 RepID=A0A0X1T341_PSEAA|nr:DUF4124 domain-containing protein [Pseudomonas agarici]AMB86546.1 hypothetical protein AWM79_15040 [Pseudomonas agarici]NWB92470.1 DUF4124 domain-containing protein [Pseudomonas agarici]NWC10716.1 DUF4124 domain-containing protein [Pseudomonas agarici]SEL50193.1 protein of unknown function [Pseudomonas agarici]
MGRPLLYLLLAFTLPVSAQIYQYTDANGNTAYSNQPPAGSAARAVELPPLNSVELQKPAQPAAAQSAATQPAKAQANIAPYSVFELTDVPTQQALRANNGTFTVGVKMEPRLQRQHLLRLVLDGNPYGQSSNVPRLQLVNVDRGDHTLSVQALEGEQLVQQSPTVAFTVQRVHTP